MGIYRIEAGGATPDQIDAILQEFLAQKPSKNRVPVLSFCRDNDDITVIRRNASTGLLFGAAINNRYLLRQAVHRLLTGPGTVTVGHLPRRRYIKEF